MNIGKDQLPEPYNTIAEITDTETAVKMAKHFGGEQLYFPKFEAVERPLRNCQIIEEFNGFNFKYLSRKHGLTEAAIRQIVKDHILTERLKPPPGQMSLLDEE